MQIPRLLYYKGPTKYILRAVMPIWHGGNEGEAEKLKNCYVGCLEKAAEAGCASIAFGCISDYPFSSCHYPLEHYPLEAITRLAILTVRDWLEQHGSNMLVKFCCCCYDTDRNFDTDHEFDSYQGIAEEIGIYG